ncbi:MAG TPA: hypothetical protein VFG89_10685 [Coriobacteriia bacterium]|nr:hypothetical protein [Coriobacteriia bacterium]
MSELPNDPSDQQIPPGAEEAVAEGLTGDDSIPLELRIQGSEDPNRAWDQQDRTGSYTFEPDPTDGEPPPEKFQDPAGSESPGQGIPGYDNEEIGGA